MVRNQLSLRTLPVWIVFPALIMMAAVDAQTRAAQESKSDIAKAIEELNRVTGSAPLQGALNGLLKDKDQSKELIEASADLAKKKKVQFSYNAALALGLSASDQKDIPSAEVFFRICMDQAAKLQSPDKILQSYSGLIEILYDNKKYAETAKVCRELLDLKTDDGTPRIVMVPFNTKFGEVDFNEQESFDAAKRIRPGVHKMLIQALAKQGKSKEALKLTENLLKTSDHWLDRAFKGAILREVGQFDEAAKIYEDVIDSAAKDKDLDPEDREAYTERYRYLLSNIYIDLDRIDKASEHLLELLNKKPDDPGYNNDLGYIWADHDIKLEEAEKLIRKAIDLDRKRRQGNPKLDPEDDIDNGAYLDSLGWVLYKQKKFKEAKEMLLEAIKDKRTQHIEIYDHLGDVCLMLGEREAAVNAWRKGLEVVGEGKRELERKTSVERKLEKAGK
ncbi:MAG: tetratricopeptide repeat protein [Planctomycetes bacterium]|nr:tetratricopeptide repeat protein [Planctomycetota bacterium]